MEKINVAELLKDCPKGMKLDCTTCNNVVTLVGVDKEGLFPIRVVSKSGFHHLLTCEGCVYADEDAKCVIFPKGKTTWEGFVPPVEFKDGDIVASNNGDYIFMLKKAHTYKDDDAYKVCNGTCYFGLALDSVFYSKEDEWYFNRLATEDEKAELFKAIKENGYRWDEETKSLEKLVEPYTEQIKETMEPITIDDFKANTKEWLIDKLESMSKDNALQAICNIHDELHKPQYPKTFEECCTILGLTELGIIGGYRHGLLTQFRNLLICRDAYWKIAGDWKFDFDNEAYYLCNEYHEIQKFRGVCDCNAALAFPTAEMRDAFYENFKELMNECKSLL